MSTRDEIIRGMATALWRSAWTEFDGDGRVPRIPSAATDAAEDLVGLYETANGIEIEDIVDRALGDGDDHSHVFALGTGLAGLAMGNAWWFEDHPRFPIKEPTFECEFDGTELTWTGETEPARNPARGPTRTGERSRFRETQRGHGRLTAVRPRPRPPAATVPDAKKRRASVPGHAKDKHARRTRKNPGVVERCIVCMEPSHPSASTDHGICYRCIEKQLFVVGRVDDDRYAVPLEDGDLPDALRDLVDLSDAEPTSTIDYGVVEARDAGAARLKTPLSGWTLYKRGGEPRDNPAGTAKFPLVCKHCIRAIRKLELGRIGTEYEDAVGSTSCPSSPDGKHEPISRR